MAPKPVQNARPVDTVVSPWLTVSLLLLWGFASSWTEVYNKMILNTFAFPITLTLAQFTVSAFIGFMALPVLGIKPYQNGHERIGMRRFWPSACAQMMGFLLTNVSYGKVAMKFAQTVKASAPLFSLAASVMVFGERYPLQLYLSLLPIMIGVAVTASTELTFDTAGFFAAVGANICFTTRSISSKRFLSTGSDSAPHQLDSYNMYHYMSVTAMVLILPIWMATDLRVFMADPSIILGREDLASLAWLTVKCGVLHWTYNQVSVMVLSLVTPLTHAISNVMRRVMVIAVSVLTVGQMPSRENILGMTMVFAGVNWYLRARAQMTARSTQLKQS